MYSETDLTTYEKNVLKKKYNNINSDNFCMCNTHKNNNLYNNNNNYSEVYNNKLKPKGNLNNYQDYNFNHFNNNNQR